MNHFIPDTNRSGTAGPVRLITIFLVLIACGPACRPASAETPLTWEACIREALTFHPDLISAQEQLNQADMNEDIARSSALPRVSVSASGSRSDGDDQSPANAYGYSISGRQLLYDGKRTGHQITAARTALTAEQYDYEVTSSRLRLNLRVAFVYLLQARRLLSLSRDIAQRRKKNLDLVELRYEAGREHRGSLLSARADVAQAEYDIQSAQRAIEMARWRLARELGRNTGKAVSIAGDMTVPEIDANTPDFEKLAHQTPFLQELAAQKEIAMIDKAAARSDFFPQIYAEASAGRNDSDWPPEQDGWSAGLSLSIPLFEGGSRRAALKKAGSGVRQAVAEEKSGYHEVLYTLFTTWSDLRDAVDRVAVGEAFLEASEERARITQVEYSNGLISFDNWTIIEDDLVRNRKTCLTYLTEAMIAHAYWIQAKGKTLKHDLEKK